MGRPRDSQQAKVRRAERAVIASSQAKTSKAKRGTANTLILFPPLTLNQAEEFAYDVVESRWWKQHGTPKSGTLTIAVVDWKVKYCNVVRNDWKPGYDCISLVDRNYLTVLHALAHKLHDTSTAWHGPEFARQYIRLVDRFVGSEAGKALRAAFTKEKVKSRALTDETKLARAVSAATKMAAELERREA